MKRKLTFFGGITLGVALTVGLISLVAATPAEEISPVEARPREDVYYPNTERLGWELPYSEFIVSGKWEVDDVLRPIYEEASEDMGREFPYPGDE